MGFDPYAMLLLYLSGDVSIVIPDASFNQPNCPFIAWGSTLAHPLPFGQGEPLFFRASTVMAAYYRAEYGCVRTIKKATYYCILVTVPHEGAVRMNKWLRSC